VTVRATHKGDFMGLPPTGKQVTFTGIAIVRIVGDKMVENWVNFDALSLMQQLGVVPMPTNNQPNQPNQLNQPLIVPSGKGKTVNILGHEITFKLTRQETGGAYFVFEAVSPPGAGVPPHVHQYEDETGYIIEGEFEIQHGDQIHKATKGSVWNFPRKMPHGFRNSGTTPGKTLWTVTPGGYLERSFEEIAALPSGGPPDMEKIMGIFKKYGLEFLPPPK
jgi:quercetin dioxygenase-like cupin family protein